MKEHGILMKGEMVRAYLEGRKWMTRRTRGLDVINKRPNDWKLSELSEKGAFFTLISAPSLPYWSKLPYGWIGDTLWFKETYAPMCREADPFCPCLTDEEKSKNHYVEYRADTGNAYPGEWPEEEAKGNDEAPKWKSSMFMKRIHSRIAVPVVNVRVERICDISEYDARAEGTIPSIVGGDLEYSQFRSGFQTLWDSINAKRGMGWDVNPWVWVYEFPKYSKLEAPIGLTATSPKSKNDLGEEVQTVCSYGYDQAKG